MDAPKPARFPRALLAKVPASVKHDEALQAKRKAVVRDMSQAFDALLRPLGFVRSGSHWCKVSAEGTSAFHFQKSWIRFNCKIFSR